MSHMFALYGISQFDINIGEKAADSLVGLRYVKEGTPFIILSALGDTSQKDTSFILRILGILWSLILEIPCVEKRSKPNEVKEQMLSGEIKNSNLTFALDQQLKDINMTGELAEYMAGVFAWSIDFFRLYPGDEFKVIYNEKSVEGIPYGIDGLLIWFKHQGREF